MKNKYIRLEVNTLEESRKELIEFQEMYTELSKTLENLVIDNKELSAYHSFIVKKNIENRITFTEQIISNDIIFENREIEIKRVANRYIRRLKLEEDRVKKSDINNNDVYENSLNLLNDIHRRLNINLKKISDSLFSGVMVDLPGLAKSFIISEKPYTGEKKYDYKID